ncbi:MAG: hypothetical protein WAQ28_02085 [Bacteroidia bacterium]
MHKLLDFAVRMQISGTEDIHVVPFVDFLKEASKIDDQARTIKIGDNNYRLDNAELGLIDDPQMKPYTAPVNQNSGDTRPETETETKEETAGETPVI